ncbi:MAG: RimJ/RimL family protein N-acetyltransferase [Saprospiraceae bacterium]|jgi:RimJ/RimL family protein N-acetyltransferase
MSPKIILKTNRLHLREFHLNDADFILKLVNSPSWLNFIGDKKVKNTAEAEKFIQEKLLVSYQINRFGLWLVELKTTNTPIGMCGLVNRENLEGIDIGFALLSEHAGQGYGFESATATMNYAKNTLQLSKVVAITNPENIASIRLLNKIGLQFEKKMMLSPIGSVLLFSADKNEDEGFRNR